MKPTLRKRLSYLLLALLDFASACDREPVDRNSAGNSIFAAEKLRKECNLLEMSVG